MSTLAEVLPGMPSAHPETRSKQRLKPIAKARDFEVKVDRIDAVDVDIVGVPLVFPEI